MSLNTPAHITSDWILDRLWDLYCENPKRFHMARNGTVFMPKIGEEPVPLQRKHVAGHLAGVYALCLFGKEEASRFICFDVDHGGWELVQKATSVLQDIGFEREKIYISTSGNKGYHIEMFFTAPIEYSLMKQLYHELLKRTEATNRDIELRPSDKRSIKIPLGKHQKTGKICWYVNTKTGEEILDRYFVLQIRRIETPLAQNFMKKCRTEAEKTKSDIIKPRCNIDVANLPNITQKGMRHDMILSIAGTLEKRGYSANECKRILNTWYARQDKELIGTKAQHVLNDIDKTVDWIYRKGHRTRSKAVIFPADVRRITSIRSMVGRAIYFHVLVWERVMNTDFTSHRQLAEAFGVTEVAVAKAKSSLIQKGYLKAVTGQHHRDKNGYYTDKTRINISGEVVMEPLEAKTEIVEPQQMQKDFWKIYFDTLFALVAEDWLMPRLYKRERDKLGEVISHELGEQCEFVSDEDDE